MTSGASDWKFTTSDEDVTDPSLVIATTAVEFGEALPSGKIEENGIRYTDATVLKYNVKWQATGTMPAATANALTSAVQVVDGDGAALAGFTVSSTGAITASATEGTMAVEVTYTGSSTAQVVGITVD